MFRVIWSILKFLFAMAQDPIIRTALADVAAVQVSDLIMGDAEPVRRPARPYTPYGGGVQRSLPPQRKPFEGTPRVINNARLHSLSLDAEPNAFGEEIELSPASRHLMEEFEERQRDGHGRFFEVDSEGTATERDED